MGLEIDLERLRLGSGPTPVQRLAEPEGGAGRAPVWIKDDGAYSEVGGNKARKLEWLLADARRRGKRAVLTGGALGTNHGLATAIFARRLGMRAILVLAPQPRTEHVAAQLARLEASGAEIHFAPGLATSYLVAAWLLGSRAMRAAGLPYPIPPGGSNALGALGYVGAAIELAGQVARGELPEPSHIVVALGSGGTAAGLVAGMRVARLRSRLVCVRVSDVAPVGARRVARLARRTLALLRRGGVRVDGRAPSPTDLDVETAWLGAGYGHPSPAGSRATALLGPRAGIDLDPVYTAKAAAALLDLNARGAFGDGPVLYWHTYGRPGDGVAAAPAGTAGKAVA